MTAKHSLYFLLFFIASISGYSQNETVFAHNYIIAKHKSPKKFSVKNKSRAKIGIIFSHNTSDTIYLGPRESKDFKYKKCPIDSEISIYISSETWETVLSELTKSYRANARLFGINDDINAAWIKYKKMVTNNSNTSRVEQRKRERGNKMVKSGQEGILENILEDLEYYKDLYDVSHYRNGRKLLPLYVKIYLGIHYQGL